MKKLLMVGAFLVLCAVPLGLFAAGNEAIDKGSFSVDVGTILGLNLYSGDIEETDFSFGTKFDVFGFGPTLNVSYFVIDKLSIGGTIAFASFKPKGLDADTMFKIGPEVNYYLPLKNEKLLVDLKGLIGFESMKAAGDDAYNQLSFGAGGAIVYLLKPDIGIYGGVDLTYGLDAKYGGENVGYSYFLVGIGAGLKVFL